MNPKCSCFIKGDDELCPKHEPENHSDFIRDGFVKCVAPKKAYRPARIVECGAPAVYIWTPRSHSERKQPMCKECGEMSAGNYPDELTPITGIDPCAATRRLKV